MKALSERLRIRWTACIDGSVGNLLQERGLEIPDNRTLPEISSSLIGEVRNNVSYLNDIIRDLGGTPVDTSWFLNDVIDFIQVVGCYSVCTFQNLMEVYET